MHNRVDDVNIVSLKPLITPDALAATVPLTDAATRTVVTTREAVRGILDGKDDRLVVIVGPCSIHARQAAMEYGQRLKALAERLSDDLCLIMRVYFEKPRTSLGWKGMINDPNMDESFDINTGLEKARSLLFALNEMGVPAATEFLDTIIPQYISELISWGAIGARTAESQIHRELASGLSMPVGFKNGTDGNVDIALDGIRAARFPHHFLGVTKSGQAAIVGTHGNAHCHIVLRGAKAHTNYDRETIQAVVKKLQKNHFTPGVMVDCSHGNSQKRPENQLLVARDLIQQMSERSCSIFAVMVESHLTAGKQTFSVGQKPAYDKSITDACIGWEDTASILTELAQAVRKRRNKG